MPYLLPTTAFLIFYIFLCSFVILCMPMVRPSPCNFCCTSLLEHHIAFCLYSHHSFLHHTYTLTITPYFPFVLPYRSFISRLPPCLPAAIYLPPSFLNLLHFLHFILLPSLMFILYYIYHASAAVVTVSCFSCACNFVPITIIRHMHFLYNNPLYLSTFIARFYGGTSFFHLHISLYFRNLYIYLVYTITTCIYIYFVAICRTTHVFSLSGTTLNTPFRQSSPSLPFRCMCMPAAACTAPCLPPGHGRKEEGLGRWEEEGLPTHTLFGWCRSNVSFWLRA